MKKAFSQLSWGLGFALLDFRFDGFDVLPDFIGYALLLAGLSKLIPFDRRFRLAWAAAGILLGISIAQLFGLPTGVSLTDGEKASPGALALVTAATSVELFLYYGICMGIREIAAARGMSELAERARSSWRFAFAVGAVLLILFPFLLNFTFSEFTLALLLLSLFSLIAGLRILFLARRAGRELTENGGDDRGGADGTPGRRLDVRA
ncbi:hypothetical protein ACF3MZ_30360 [Paenibacillaceae bacterium WGS1546]|uniref:hypothetical protein n=1 Tax=Cohnella sp. WGS1546 TaxID=3366810 RepID=UPI00372D506B